MGLIKGGFLRLVQTFLYLLCFCCAGLILAIYSYFLSVLADRGKNIPTYEKAVEGLSGGTVVYTILAMLLTCCLGGVTVFAFLGILLDLIFCGAMIAIAVLARSGANSCKGFVRTPLGNGQASTKATGFSGDNITYSVGLDTACKLNTAAFAVAIIGAILFLITAAMQLLLMRQHKKEKRYGPSPSNNYTSGYGSRARGLFAKKDKKGNVKDVEMDAPAGSTVTPSGGLAAPAHDTRPSHDTAYTGSTVATPAAGTYDKVEGATHPTHGGGYYTAPAGSIVNPYGYENENRPTHITGGTATNY